MAIISKKRNHQLFLFSCFPKYRLAIWKESLHNNPCRRILRRGLASSQPIVFLYFYFILPTLNIRLFCLCRYNLDYFMRQGWRLRKKYFGVKMSFNVLGSWRLGQAIVLCEANVPCPKCGEAKHHKGRIARLGFCVARPTDRWEGGSSYRLLNDGFAAYNYSYIKFDINSIRSDIFLIKFDLWFFIPSHLMKIYTPIFLSASPWKCFTIKEDVFGKIFFLSCQAGHDGRAQP